MNLPEALFDQETHKTLGGRVFGVVVGVVTNNKDPDGMGRVKVKFPWLSKDEESQWARIASPMAGKKRGVYFLPEVNDEVLIAFDHGDVRSPYVLGALWNGNDVPPENNGDGKNNVRLIQSRSGHVIRLTDEPGNERIEIVDNKGNSIVFDASQNTIAITADKDITLSAAQGTIKLDAQKIEMKTSADTKIEAGAGMDIKASATMNVKGATVNIN